MSANWSLKGTYFETCNCDAACPCVFLSAPTTGECTVLVGWHIDQGSFDGLSLDDLNIVMAVHSPGHMAEVKWQAALYLDERADASQQQALTTIFGGQAGGHPAALASHVGEILGVASVAIDYQADGKRRCLSIPNVAEAEIEAVAGQGGADITIDNHPLAIAPGNAVVVSRSKKLTYNDHGLSWDLSGKNGFFSPFSYQAA